MTPQTTQPDDTLIPRKYIISGFVSTLRKGSDPGPAYDVTPEDVADALKPLSTEELNFQMGYKQYGTLLTELQTKFADKEFEPTPRQRVSIL